MKVLMLNGSPHKEGCTWRALCEIAKELEKEGIAIGQTIKKYRKLRGLTQEQLADMVCISISYLTKIEAPNCDQPFSLEHHNNCPI